MELYYNNLKIYKNLSTENMTDGSAATTVLTTVNSQQFGSGYLSRILSTKQLRKTKRFAPRRHKTNSRKQRSCIHGCQPQCVTESINVVP